MECLYSEMIQSHIERKDVELTYYCCSDPIIQYIRLCVFARESNQHWRYSLLLNNKELLRKVYKLTYGNYSMTGCQEGPTSRSVPAQSKIQDRTLLNQRHN